MNAKVTTAESRRIFQASQTVLQFSESFGRKKHEARLQLLEVASCRVGSHSTRDYFAAFGLTPIVPLNVLEDAAAELVSQIDATRIEPALVLSALAREQLDESDRRATGAYHTDFRLARRLARSIAGDLTPNSRVLDPACGAGILLAALVLEVCGHDRRATARFLRHGVNAADLSVVSLRGALLSLASLTDNLDAIVEMRKRWLAGDSLLLPKSKWSEIAPGGFDAIIANPPWERVRLTRHEFARSGGSAVHYGATINAEHLDGFQAKRKKIASYADRLAERHPLILRGEPDLYAAFMSLYLEQLSPAGRAAVLVPGGLIRSQGTAPIRHALFDCCDLIEIGIFDNRARFFGIDTRFKFLALTVRRGRAPSGRADVLLTHEAGTTHSTEVVGRARLSSRDIARLSADMSLPEVASEHAWRLFKRLARSGQRMDNPESPWYVDPCRELDMTSDRSLFSTRRGRGHVPVIEGRHIHQFRFGAKAYRSGSGRAANWEALPLGSARIRAQFHVSPDRCSQKALERISQWRAGFCDIAGQTNERAMMAALIPPGVACGNKVPTLVFPNDPGIDRIRAWTAVVNSFAFDWMLRRVLTTTINYFVLYGVPLPDIRPGGLPWRRVCKAVEALSALDQAGRTPATDATAAKYRTQIEVEVCQAYDLSSKDMALMLDDFPLLDRGQPALPGEARSTVTRDTVLSALARRRHEKDSWGDRAFRAQALGAVPYIPAALAGQALMDRGVGSDAGSETQ